MTMTRSEDAKPGDLAVHVRGDVVRLVRRKDPVDPMRAALDAGVDTLPGWWVDRPGDSDGGGVADVLLDGDGWTIVTLDQVRAMAAALRAGIPG